METRFEGLRPNDAAVVVVKPSIVVPVVTRFMYPVRILVSAPRPSTVPLVVTRFEDLHQASISSLHLLLVVSAEELEGSRSEGLLQEVATAGLEPASVTNSLDSNLSLVALWISIVSD